MLKHKYLFFCFFVTLFLFNHSLLIAQYQYFDKSDSSFYTYELSDSILVPGKSYYGNNNYIQYIYGTLPIVLSAPHGGYDKPDAIKDRSYGSDHLDRFTMEILLDVTRIIFEKTGQYPHTIVSRIHRIKLDPNREITVAAQGDSLAIISYKDFHRFIEFAEEKVIENWKEGIYIDLHSMNHKNQRIELGYLLESELLNLPDEDLDNDLFIEKSSIKNLVRKSNYSFIQLLRDSVSFGDLLAAKGYPSIPSSAEPSPLENSFFSGGFNTYIHGGYDNDNFIGIQIELPWNGIRDTEDNRAKFSENLADIILEFIRIHYNYNFIKDTK